MNTAIDIAFGLYDTTARQDSTLAFSGEMQDFSSLGDLKAEEGAAPPPAATLEEDYFLLDGSFQPFPDQPSGETWGLWSREMSGADGQFAQPLRLTAEFDSPHSSVGLTLRFDLHTGDCPSRIKARWYDPLGNLLHTGEFTGSDGQWLLESKVENYAKVVLEFAGTSRPWRYLKVTGLDYGATRVLGPEEIVSAHLTEEIDPASARLPVNMLEFSLHSDERGFSLLNPQGTFSLLQQRQKLSLRGYLDGAERYLGGFYLKSWENDGEGGIRMTAQDAVGLMDETTFLGGVYSGVSGLELLEEILVSAGVEHEISPLLPERTLSGWLPVCSHREALRRVAFAMGASADCSRRDGVRLEPLPQRPSALIPLSRKLEGQRTGLRERVTGVDLTVHTYQPGQESRELFRDTLGSGRHRVLLARPAHGLAVSGGVLEASGANYADILVAAPGEVTLTGTEYSEGKRIAACRAELLPPGEAERLLTVEDATILDAARAGEDARRVYDYYANRYQSSFTMLPGTEEVSWMVVAQGRDGHQLKGRIEAMETDLTGGFLAKVRMTGTPLSARWQYYSGELYAGEEKGAM